MTTSLAMPGTSDIDERLASIPPDLDLFEEIERLKTERKAVLLAHYYQDPDIQDVADYIGDSLGLAQQAAKTEAEVIVFAGVHFMAETAKILNPDKLVLLPDLEAGCSLADACPPDEFGRFIDEHPGHNVVSYINCSAGVKALSDVIVTSSNAEKIIRQLPEDKPIIFAPDKNLGRYIAEQTGREMVLWEGTCIVHEMFSEKKLLQLKAIHPEALIIAHPECEDSILNHADHIASTTGLIRFAAESDAHEFIVATEVGILHEMKKVCGPGKIFYPSPPDNQCACNECPHMKRNTLEKLYLCLRDSTPELILDEDLARRSLIPIQRMLEMS